MTEPTINHSSCLRAAKSNMTKAGKELASLDESFLSKLDPRRIERGLDSLRRATESFEMHLEVLRTEKPDPEIPYDEQLFEHREIYQRHYEGFTTLQSIQNVNSLMSRLTLSLTKLERSTVCGYSASLNYDLDHATSISHGVIEAHGCLEPGLHLEIEREGDELSARLHKLLKLRLDYVAASTPIPIVTTVAPAHSHHAKVQALKMDLPTFNGDIKTWHTFWKLLTALFKQHPELTDEVKQAHVIHQMGTEECRREATAAFEHTLSYDAAIDRLRAVYERPRELLRHYVQITTNQSQFRNRRSDVKELADAFETCVSGMKRIGAYTISQYLTSLFVRYMEPDLLAHWGRATELSTIPPDETTFMNFLRRHVESFPPDSREHQARPRRIIKQEKKVMRVHARSEERDDRSCSPPSTRQPSHPTAKCLCCSDYHSIYTCVSFKRMSCREKKDLVRRLELCYNCLNPNHRATECNSKRTCNICNSHHHTLLHEEVAPNNTRANVESSVKVTKGRSTVITHCAIPRTALAAVRSNHTQQYGRVQFDSGAEVSLITKKFATQMKARRIPNSRTTISGVEGSFESPYQVVLTLQGLKGEQLDVQFRLVDHLAVSGSTANLQEVLSLPFLHGLKLADPHYGTHSQVDMLLDMGSSLHCSRDELIRSEDRFLRAENTIFGWTVGGRHHCDPQSVQQSPQVLTVVPTKDDLDETVRLLWAREEFPSETAPTSTQDEQALSHFKDNVCRTSDGTYSVSLPKKTPAVKLGESRQMALRRTLSTERRHQRRGDGERYQASAREYAILGHAEPVPPTEIHNPCELHYHLPIHSVIKPSSSSTKFRLVFDASAKSANGISLNDILLPGPSVCSSLISTLLRFRSYKHGMTSDITKMFRGVLLNPPDRDYHRFFLRSEQGNLELWRMNRVTFGVTSSPFLATQVLREIASEYQERYPEAALAIQQSFYVDDCLVGADDVETAQQLREDVNSILELANMVICKWRTSSPALTETIPERLREADDHSQTLAPNLCAKTLGIHWDADRDNLHIATPSISLSPSSPPTKRDLLSAIARVYDILGWHAPAVLSAKLIMQETWRLGLRWEEPLPEDLQKRMKDWCSQLPLLTQHPVPRCYYHKDLERQSVQLHGFADASTKGYGGVVYVRAMYSDHSISVSLIMSRAKVVPVKKPQSIPRLELCAAVMTARMMTYVGSMLDVSPTEFYCWSDSSAVLGWVNTSPPKLDVYVGNRVHKLSEYTPPDTWRYVNTVDNPADCLSRGMLPLPLVAHELWWHGPSWLQKEASCWPKRPDINLARELPDAPVVVSRLVPTEPEMGYKSGSFLRLVRVVAWMKRFIQRSRDKFSLTNPCNHSLSSQELQAAQISLLRYSQRTYYSQECELLARHIGGL